MLKKILEKILAILAKIIIKRYHPIIVGITGSVGKTSTKCATYRVLKDKYSTRESFKNYNNEIGVPLTILGEKSPGKNLLKWLKIFIKAIGKTFVYPSFPKILILEMAVDKPGDMDYLLKIAKPSRSIITAISPAHTKFLGSVEGVLKEKQKIATSLGYSGWAILNADDSKVLGIKNKISSKVITYGLSDKSDVQAVELNFIQDFNGRMVDLKGVSFKLKYKGSIVPVFLPKATTKAQVYASLASVAAAITLGINVVEAAKRLSKYKPLPGRMRPIYGIKSSLILDDTYNASPRALEFSLKTLQKIKKHPQSKKWVIIGDMKELGRKSQDIHYEFGKKIAQMDFNYLVTVGPEAKHLAKGARLSVMDKDNIFEFDNSQKAGEFIKEKLGTGDTLLIKGSQAVRMEKIVEKIMKEKDKVEELLVRQGEKWK